MTSHLRPLYGTSLFLLTDLYQLTMAQGYWHAGMADHEGVFHLFFRKPPFGGGYTIAAGLALVVDLLRDWHLDEEDHRYLASLTDRSGGPLFSPDFLHWLATQRRWNLAIDAVAEGTVVFPHQPLIRVQGPIIACQLLETALLNIVNFSSLIATKAARICSAAGDQPVLEFGLRRAQGVDGAIAASRAAFIGGCAATSNVLAGRLLGIPVRGTHAHSWVMSFDTEREAFHAYARAMPGNCTFLVDTYDTLEGVRNAIDAGRWLRTQGRDLLGIRLDSGDLAWLSIEARRLLDEAGFTEAVIVASNDLDEHLITSLKHQGARIAAWGVGTRIVTGHDQPALGGVYKLGAIRQPGGPWKPRIKLSEQLIKISNPGILQVLRHTLAGKAIGDALIDEEHPVVGPVTIVDHADPTRRKTMPPSAVTDRLLQPLFRGGDFVGTEPSLAEIRDHARAQLALFDPTILRIDNPHTYPAGLELGLHQRKMDQIFAARQTTPTNGALPQ
jgi:nicotinate phosphoribosyltransferase